MARYVVIGAGAIGGGVAGMLAVHGTDVVAVARGRHAEAIAAAGLRVRFPEDTVRVDLDCVVGPDELELRPDDVLVLATKTHQASEALRSWSDATVVHPNGDHGAAGDVLPVVTALNGLAAEEIAHRWFRRVVGACVWMPAVHLEPGDVIVRGTPIRGTFHLAPVPAVRAETQVLDEIDRDWTAAGFRIVRPDDVMPWKARKLVTNLGNVFQALVGSNGRLGPLVRAAHDEARRVLAHAGVDVVSDEDERAEREASGLRVEPVEDEPAELGGSSWQSLARGTGDIETDYLNGEIVRLAHRCGTTAPVNAAVTRHARRAARRGHRPGDVSAAELAAELGIEIPERS